MGRRKKLLKGASLLAGFPIALVLSALVTEHRPAERESVNVVTLSQKPLVLKRGVETSVLSWNLQFCASRNHHFFYDGGEVVHVPEEDVMATVQSIKEVLAAHGVDIALLQEIDRNNARTKYIDQMRELVTYRSGLSWAAAPYHRSPFVPFPFSNPMGRVDMNLGVLSRFGIENASRHQLPLLDESRVRQAFNLKRAILDAEIPIEGSSLPLHVGVTHLSAFSFGDGTLKRQVAALDKWMSSHPKDQPWILAGDLNLLPPADDPRRLGEDGALYADQDNPIEALLPKYNEAFGDPMLEKNRTYLPFGADKPDRKIDYIFYGGPIEITGAEVLRQHSVSDHLPLLIRLKLGA
jgi:endonuclease/exonuclease/phosphatase family metal-dependent hydrolase